MAEIQPIIEFRGSHFVRHLGMCNPIYDKFLDLIWGVITHNSVKNEVSILVNG